MSRPTYDPHIYTRCMEELKARINLIDNVFVNHRLEDPINIADVEMACLQLRKCYELIVFASISTNRKSYKELRAKYEKDWRLVDIMKSISNINKNFLPMNMNNPGNNLTTDNIKDFHGRLGDILHARNPYADPPDYKEWYNWICQRRDEIVRWLGKHLVILGGNSGGMICYMNYPPDGTVQFMALEVEKNQQ